MSSTSRTTKKTVRSKKRRRVAPAPEVRERTVWNPYSAVRRPALQVVEYTWTNTGQPITVSKDTGYVALLSMFPRGSGEDQRHTNETILYKMDLKMQLAVVGTTRQYVGRYPGVVWLIYDSSPTGSLPTNADIFTATHKDSPLLWRVKREMCHRYVVKRRFTYTAESNGLSDGFTPAVRSNGCPPCNVNTSLSRFCKRLGVRTEWKNSSTGDIGDIQTGALYVCVQPGNGSDVYAKGSFRVYFKSIGNQ